MISAKSIFPPVLELGCHVQRSKHFPIAKSNGPRFHSTYFHPSAMAVSKAVMSMPRRIQLWADCSRATVVSIALAIAMLVAAPSYAAAAARDTSAVGVHGMVVSESEYAARAGVEILKHGGNAVDSAVATALAVGVTNPAACGIGGGGFMLIYIAKTHAFYALDYPETAPLQARPDMYLRNGHPNA